MQLYALCVNYYLNSQIITILFLLGCPRSMLFSAFTLMPYPPGPYILCSASFYFPTRTAVQLLPKAQARLVINILWIATSKRGLLLLWEIVCLFLFLSPFQEPRV